MELIELHELSEWILNWLEKDHYYHPFSKQKNIPIGELNDILNQIPRVDAIQVVRCKECKYLLPNDRIAPNWWRICDYWRTGVDENEYCARGERKEK